MPITTLSIHEFHNDVSGAQKATASGPVFITEHGQPKHVLLSIEDYGKLTGVRRSIIDAIAMTDNEEVEFEPAPVIIAGTTLDL